MSAAKAVTTHLSVELSGESREVTEIAQRDYLIDWMWG